MGAKLQPHPALESSVGVMGDETHQQRGPELDAGADLELGKFTNCDCLSNSEVAQVLSRKLKGSGDAKDDNDPARDMQVKFKEYLERFAHFETTESLAQVRELVQAKKEEFNLTNFEVTQLSNLCPSTSEEARSLIKSLQTKIQDEHLQSILDEMSAFRKYE